MAAAVVRDGASPARASCTRRSTCTRPTAAWCPSWRRATTCAASRRWSASALAQARRAPRAISRGVAVTAGPGSGRLAAGRALLRQGARLSPRASRSSACTTSPATSPPPSSPTPRLAPPYLGLGGLGRAHGALPDRGRRRRPRCSARRATTPSARPSTRSRSCSGSPIRADPRSRARPRRATSARSRSRARWLGEPGSRLLLQRAQDRRRARGRAAARRGARSARGRSPTSRRPSRQAATDVLVAQARRALAPRGPRGDSPWWAAWPRTGACARAVEAAARADGFAAIFPPLALCTDNAAMIAAAGARRLARGERHGARLDAFSRVPSACRAALSRAGVSAPRSRGTACARTRRAGRTSSSTTRMADAVSSRLRRCRARRTR